MTDLSEVAVIKAEANAHAHRLFAMIGALSDECAQTIKLAEKINALHDRLAAEKVDSLLTEADRKTG